MNSFLWFHLSIFLWGLQKGDTDPTLQICSRFHLTKFHGNKRLPCRTVKDFFYRFRFAMRATCPPHDAGGPLEVCMVKHRKTTRVKMLPFSAVLLVTGIAHTGAASSTHMKNLAEVSHISETCRVRHFGLEGYLPFWHVPIQIQ